MTSIPQVTNAPAVYLFKEETTEDALHMHSFYVRLKVLTEGGKEYADVELPYYAGEGGTSIDSIAARTIQPDGTVVPFTGKPYEKLIKKSQGGTVKSKVFTLPAAQVGSILEYRYKIRYGDEYLQSPQWFIQSPLYTIKAHYNWKPQDDGNVTSSDGGDRLSSIAWTPILPAGAKVIETESGASGARRGGGTVIDLVVADVPPIPVERDSPPLDSVSYRVLFYYTSFRTSDEYWSKQGKRWSKERDKFMNVGSAVKDASAKAVSPGDSDEVKLKKIYDAVMRLENTDFTRSRSAQEERASGLKPATSADDILKRARGTGDELAMTFVAMARAAGIKAYIMGVANRSQRLFLPPYLSFSQLDDLIAIVPLAGKDRFFDPGTRYCTFGQLAWIHANSGGLRQTDDGVKLLTTLPEVYTENNIKRIADLKLDDRGEATGSVTLTYTGDPALTIRHQALRGDDTSLNTELRSRLEEMLPGGIEVRVVSAANLTDPDKPVVIDYSVKGAIGNVTGKRLFIPASLFEVNSKPEFTAPKRELTIDMHYPRRSQDAVRIKYPGSLAVEAAPAKEAEKLGEVAAFTFSSTTAADSITMFRDVIIARTFFQPKDYADLRTFYGKLESKQQEPLILTHAADTAKPSAGGN